MEHSKRVRHLARDAFVWAVTSLGVAARYRRRVKADRPLVRVVSFHDVRDGEWFESLVERFTKECAVISPEDFHEGRFDEECINLLLTFDDGYASWVETVLPVLERHNIKGLFFVCSGLLDAANDRKETALFMQGRLLIRPRKPLTWKGARTLAEAGHTIGGHTRNHRRLAALEERDLRGEIMGDKRALEEGLSATLTDFAYPFGARGDYTDAAKDTAVEAGYGFIYTAESGFMGPSATHIPRTLIEEHQSPSSVIRWVNGGYDIFSYVRTILY